MKELPFSTVSYKQDVTLKDILEVERWVEKHLKRLSMDNSRHSQISRKILYEQRSGVPYTHFIKQYKDHKRALERIKRKL